MENNNDKESRKVYSFMKQIYERDDITYLELGNRCGPTGYIDFIEEREITHSIMKSRDYFNRRVIIMKFILYNTVFIQTFFQRYSNNLELWIGAIIRGSSPSLMDTVGGITRHQAKLLLKVSEGYMVVFDEDHIINNHYNHYSKYILLYDENKIKSAKIIQYYWDICRWNPKYKIAKKYINESYRECMKPFSKIIN